MSSTPYPRADEPATDGLNSIIGTLPLLVLTAILFVGSYVTYLYSPHLGPDSFPLWGLMLTLGFVAAIGSVVSWFFAAEENEPAHSVTATDSEGSPPDGATSRAGFGRPAPDSVARRLSPPGVSNSVVEIAPKVLDVEPWDEDALPPVATHGPRPVLTTLEDPGDIGRALEEIADIQRQLATRRASAAAGSQAPARA